jgi:hypothetical protein
MSPPDIAVFFVPSGCVLFALTGSSVDNGKNGWGKKPLDGRRKTYKVNTYDL